MLRPLGIVVGLFCFAALPALAQEPQEVVVAPVETPELTASSPYEEKSPARQDLEARWELIHARAKYRAAQRLKREELRKWYGYAPMRPAVTPISYYRLPYPQRHHVYYLPVQVAVPVEVRP